MGAATTLPIEAPELKIPCANALCFAGNHSPLLFTAPGHNPASPRPSNPRTIDNETTPLANA